MKYESAKTPKGNIGVSYVSQDAADAQAAQMDASGCTNCAGCTNCMYCANCTECTDCTNCAGCTNCANCTDCANCTYCTNCAGCTYCAYCAGCTYCTYCAYCTGCANCAYCTECAGCTECTGTLVWGGLAATRLFSLNGLRWPVAISETHMQIGCQNHSHEAWGYFSDAEITQMGYGVFEFWEQWKPTLMAACAWKAGGGK